MPASKKLIVVYLLSVIISIKAESNIQCPRFCQCDSYMQLNRAQCSSKRLISAEVEAPKVVQILDLSYNDINIIERSSFTKYVHLKYLNLSHNAIQGLDLDSFSSLKRLVEIDLSYNRLEYLDERIFERNHRLEKLSLEGNKFMSISVKPLLRSTSLLELNLKKAQLTFIHKSIFAELPNLVKLDLSQNLLNTLRVEDFQGLKHLKSLSISENVIKCDQSMQQKLKQLKNLNIDVTMDLCQEALGFPAFAGVEKFQKMTIMEEELDHPVVDIFNKWRLNLDTDDELEDDDDDDDDISAEANDNSPLANNEWLRFAPDAVLCETQKYKLCQNYRKCLVSLNSEWHEKRSLDAYNSGETKFAFILGAACGITAVILLLTCALCLKNCCEARKKESLVVIEPDPNDVSGQPLARQHLPPQVRRQPRRRAAPQAAPQRPVVRYEGPVGENFISRLFGRPARHQYYRTINQNTATLIRRLSRSNLFNNRLSQHFTDRQNSNEQNAAAESQGYSPSAPRPETPPPCYGDVVIGCEEGRK